MAGRPLKLTNRLLTELNEIADDAWSINDACAYLGIHNTTWQAWRTQGNTDRETGNHATVYARFSILAARVGAPKRRRVAWSKLRQVLEGDIKAEPHTVVSAALGLLRLDVALRSEVTGLDGAPLNPDRGLDLSRLSDEQLVQLHALTALAERDADAGK